MSIISNFDHLVPSKQALLSQLLPQALSQVFAQVHIMPQLVFGFRQEALTFTHSFVPLPLA